MRAIQLGGKSTLVALVDDSDYESLSAFSWTGFKSHVLVYAGRYDHRKYVSMHRLIAGAKEHEQVDHINGNSLDNRRENLRLVTAAQQAQNKKVATNNVCGYRGVSKNLSRLPRKKIWMGAVQMGGRTVWKKYFETPESAHEAVVSMRAKLMTHVVEHRCAR